MRPNLTCVTFCRRVLRLALTNGQTAFVAVAIDHVLPRDLGGAVREAALLMFGDIDDVPPIAWRTIAACCGRDSGKTELAAAIALYKLLTVDISRTGPGDVPTAAVVAPKMKTARILLRRAVARVEQSKELAPMLQGKTHDGFTLRRPDDGRLVAFEVFAADRGGSNLRGYSLVALLLDEAAQFRDSEAVVNDETIYAAAMPRLLPEGVAMFLSTPWSEEGLFYKLANANQGSPSSAIAARASTLVMRDFDPVHVAIVAAERERDPDNAAREFDAGFMAAGSSLFFDPSSITDAIDDAGACAPLAGGELVFCGADIGLVKDSSAIAAVARLERRIRLVEHLELRPSKGEPLKLSRVVETFAEVCKRRGADGFMADGHAREPAREYADLHKIEIHARPEGASAKYDTFVALRTAFLERRVLIPNAPRLLAQLRAIHSKPRAGGSYDITSPRRVGQAHGDIVSALVLGAWSATRDASTFDGSDLAVVDMNDTFAEYTQSYLD